MLPIKTAAHRTSSRIVRAVLATPSLRGGDIDNLTGQHSDATVTFRWAPPYPYGTCHAGVAFTATRRVPVRYTAATAVPGYLVWNGAVMWALPPHVFVRDYAVMARYDPLPGDPVPCLTPLSYGRTLNGPRGEDRAAPGRNPST